MFKRTIIASAVLLATSSVWAASANNQATVAQTGNNNLATVEQIDNSNHNQASISQIGADNEAKPHKNSKTNL